MTALSGLACVVCGFQFPYGYLGTTVAAPPGLLLSSHFQFPYGYLSALGPTARATSLPSLSIPLRVFADFNEFRQLEIIQLSIPLRVFGDIEKLKSAMSWYYLSIPLRVFVNEAGLLARRGVETLSIPLRVFGDIVVAQIKTDPKRPLSIPLRVFAGRVPGLRPLALRGFQFPYGYLAARCTSRRGQRG